MKNKLNIEDIKLLIPDYITGSLSEDESLMVKNAIDNSSELKELYIDMKNAFEFTDSVKFEEPAAQYWNNLLPKIHQKIDEREQQSLAKNPMSYLWKILVPVAAVVLIFISYRISFVSGPEITQKEEKIYKQENTEAKDTVKKGIESVQTEKNLELEISKENTVIKKTHRIKKNDIKHPENYAHENIEKKDVIIKVNEENEDFASLVVEELTIFGAGSPGVFDEDVNNELDKLNDSDRETFLEELNRNL
jgi:hypothetical protein